MPKLTNADPKIFRLIKDEEKRQRETLQMIPSENYASQAVMAATGSVLTNKYSEGYPGRRYYQGNKVIDEVEALAIERAKKLFGVDHANVQPYSGSPANSAVYFALCKPGDTVMGLKLSAGGHLTHGHPSVTFSGKYFRSVQFGLDEKGLIDYDEIKKLAKKEKPKVMLVGTTAYPLKLNWKKFAEIADETGAYLVTDIAHIAGLILGGAYPSPARFAHVITTTTHKTLRGPRGAMILVTKKGAQRDPDLPGKINSAIIPGLQGGPHNNTTAAIAQCLYEAGKPSFKKYAQNIIKNAKTLADEFKKGGLTLVANGTESHLMVIDLRPQNLSGNVVAIALEEAGIICNFNSVPNDSAPPFYPSGIRLGTPALTTQGMKEREMKKIAKWTIQVIDHVRDERLPQNPKERASFLKNFQKKAKRDRFLKQILREIKTLATRFPVP